GPLRGRPHAYPQPGADRALLEARGASRQRRGQVALSWSELKARARDAIRDLLLLPGRAGAAPRGHHPGRARADRVVGRAGLRRDLAHRAPLHQLWALRRPCHPGRRRRLAHPADPNRPRRPHPPLYQVCVTNDAMENTALRGRPMLNSVLFGPVDQLIANRDIYVDTLKKAGRGADEVKSLLARWGVSRQIYVAETDARALAEA